MLKKTKWISMLLCCSLLMVGCTTKSNDDVTNEKKEPVELSISAAASLKELGVELFTRIVQ